MPKLSIELSERTKQLAESRATESGYGTIDDYFESLVRLDSGIDYGASVDLVCDSQERLVELLDEADSTPRSEMTNADWDDLCDRVTRRHGTVGA